MVGWVVSGLVRAIVVVVPPMQIATDQCSALCAWRIDIDRTSHSLCSEISAFSTLP